MSDQDNDDPAAAADDPIVEISQSKLNSMMAKARREGRGERAPSTSAPAAPAPSQALDVNTLAQAIVAAQRAAAGPHIPTPPMAPSAPDGRAPEISERTVIDLFALQPHQIRQLGPQGVRKVLERTASAGRAALGLPELPQKKGR